MTLARREFLGSALALGASAALPGCCCPGLFAPGHSWNNAIRTNEVQVSERTYPKTCADLVDAVVSAEARKGRVRMTGSGHSFSDVAVTTDHLLSPECLDRPLELDRARLKDPRAEGLVRVMSGMRVRDLNRHLDEQGRALFNMGGYDGQTVAGVVMTSTHGSGRAYGPIASQVASLQVVTEHGKVLQIEPSQGITDPRKFSGKLEEDPGIAVELVQNDDLFRAVAVSMGCLGVVYSVTIRTDRKFWLLEQRWVENWSRLKRKDGMVERLISGRAVRLDLACQPEHVEIYISPYERAGDHDCLVTQRWRLYEPPSDWRGDDQRGSVIVDIGSALGAALSWIGGAQAFLELNPCQVPDTLHMALKGMADDGYVAPSFDVFNVGVVNDARALGIEMSFDARDTIVATDLLCRTANRWFKQGIITASPVGLRWVKQSDLYASMMYQRDTFTMEIDTITGLPRTNELLTDYENVFMKELGARPHWGLDLDVLQSADRVAELNPGFKEWLRVHAARNTTGVFDGKLTDRLKISRA